MSAFYGELIAFILWKEKFEYRLTVDTENMQIHNVVVPISNFYTHKNKVTAQDAVFFN